MMNNQEQNTNNLDNTKNKSNKSKKSKLSSYNIFITNEIENIKQLNPLINRRDAFKQAILKWNNKKFEK